MDFASLTTGQLKTGQDRIGLLRSHLWCPNDLARLWDVGWLVVLGLTAL